MAAGVLVEESQHQEGLAAGGKTQAGDGLTAIVFSALGQPGRPDDAPFHAPFLGVQGDPGEAGAVGGPEETEHPVILAHGLLSAAVGGYDSQSAVGRGAVVLAVGDGDGAAVGRPEKGAGSFNFGQAQGRIVGIIGPAEPNGLAVAAGGRPGQLGSVGRPGGGAEGAGTGNRPHLGLNVLLAQPMHSHDFAAVDSQGLTVRGPVKVEWRAPGDYQRRRRRGVAVGRVGVHDEEGQTLRGSGGDTQSSPVGRPLHVMGGAVGDGQRGGVDEHGAADSGG